MYHAFVRRQARRAFADLSKGDVARHLSRFAARAVLRTHDATAGSGLYEGRDAIAMAFRRLFASVPQHDFHVEDVWVKGPPFDTRVAVSWTDCARGADGTPQVRSGMNRIRLAWGRVTEEDVFIFPAVGD
jgi:ketosteroid isomerase-like protein